MLGCPTEFTEKVLAIRVVLKLSSTYVVDTLMDLFTLRFTGVHPHRQQT